MGYEPGFENLTAFTALLDLMQLGFVIGVYLLVSFATLSIFNKTGSATWKAWVPVVREWEMFRLAGMSPVWAIVLVGGSIILSVIAVFLIIAFVFGIIAFADQGDIGAAVLTGVGGMALFFLFMFGWIVFSYIIRIKMMNRINRGFGQSLWFTLLGIAVYPAWLAIIAWSKSRWYGTPNMDAPHGLLFPNGARVQLFGGDVFIGTTLTREGIPESAQVVTVTDQSGSVAPVHARLNRVGDNWVVTNLSRSGGLWAIDQLGHTHPVHTTPTTVQAFMLGNVRFDVVS